MPIMDPKRALSRYGRQSILLPHLSTEQDSPYPDAKLILVTDATVAPDGETISDLVAAVEGMGVIKTITEWTTPAMSGTGKYFMATDVKTWTAAGVTGPQVIKGVVVTATNLASGVLAYLEFDDPILVDADDEVLLLALEMGFDGAEFYLAPRVVPLGV